MTEVYVKLDGKTPLDRMINSKMLSVEDRIALDEEAERREARYAVILHAEHPIVAHGRAVSMVRTSHREKLFASGDGKRTREGRIRERAARSRSHSQNERNRRLQRRERIAA